MELLFTVLVFIFVIGVMILVHEWGHFIAAKKIGIAVETFSIGFGPKLFGWKRGETEYRISALPFGGYVKMLAENPDEETTGDPREYLSRTRFERFIVLVMGPALNILLAFLIWTAILMIGVERPRWYVDPPRVDYLISGSPAEQAGIEQGDLIEKVNGQPMSTWEDLLFAVASSPREEISVTVRRDGELLNFRVDPQEDELRGIGTIGIAPVLPALISGIEAHGVADRAGLREGDRVLAIDGVEVSSFNDIQELVFTRSLSMDALRALTPSCPLWATWEIEAIRSGVLDLELKLQREAETFNVVLRPEFDPEVGFRRIGIKLPTVIVRDGLLEAPVHALELCVTNVGRLIDIIGKMITGRLSTKAVSGPLEIAAISGRTAERGIIPLLELMAFISLNLGIINLLPLPVLDGGSILILAIEGAARRDLSLKTKEWIIRVGVFMLLLLMALVLYQDIEKMLSGLG